MANSQPGTWSAGYAIGENSRTTNMRAFVMRFVSSGLAITRAIPNPTETAITAHSSMPGRSSGEMLSLTP